MRSEASRGAPDLHAYKRWKPDAQQRALTKLHEAQNADWHPFYCLNLKCNGQPHVWPNDDRECPWRYGHVWLHEGHWYCRHCGVDGVLLDEWDFPHAREDQRPPRWSDPWLTLLFRGGRGSGKTRSGAEITNRVTKVTPRIILVGATGPDLRETMVEGVSGILACSPPGKKPTWEPSRKRLVWPNGCIGQGFSAEEPDRLRGPASGYIWADEPSHWVNVGLAWKNMLYGHRMKGKDKRFGAKIVATSTPKPNDWTRKEVKKETTVDRVVHTDANVSNLVDSYVQNVIEPDRGTRMGRQELGGEILEDVEGSLWKLGMIQHVPYTALPEFRKITIAVDPAGTANKRSDETGIIVIAIGKDGNLYVLEDATGKYSPAGWGNMVARLHRKWGADDVAAEKNFGADMVRYVLENEADKADEMMVVKEVDSRRGKQIRAEPVVQLYEKGKVFHVGPEGSELIGEDRGPLAKLEDEQTTWVPGEGDSPNRVDAVVHGIRHLHKRGGPTQWASPAELSGQYRLPTGRPGGRAA